MMQWRKPLRPYQSANDPAFSETVVHETSLHMWLIVIGSFLLIVVLTAMAIRQGRRALRISVNDTSLAQLKKWASGSLLGGLVIGLVPLLLLTGRGRVLILSADLTILFPSNTMAGAVGSFILSGIAARHTRAGFEQTAAWRTMLRVVARICLVVAPIVMLAGFILLALYTQIIAAFYPVW